MASGFSILEALISAVLFLVVMLGVYLLLDTFQPAFWRAQGQVNAQKAGRDAVEMIRQEFRNAGYDPSATGQAAVQNMTANSLEFITDLGDNNVSDLVKYDRDAGTSTLRRTVKPWAGAGWGGASVTTLARNVDSLTFQYFPSAAIPGLSRIRITVQTSQAVPTQATQAFQVVTDVYLRNL